MISTVLFDMNDVLCRYHRQARVEHLARVCGRSPAFVDQAIWGSGYEDLGDCGDMDADAYLRGFGERLGCALPARDWAAALRAAVTPMPETLALAASVGRKPRVAVLTNNNLMVKRTIAGVFPELQAVFGEHIYVSAEFRARKPAPEAYLGCLARLGAAPNETLFVDDSGKNVEGALSAGLRAHLYRSAAALADELRKEGVI